MGLNDKAVSGDRLRIPATDWNACLDAARAHQANKERLSGFAGDTDRLTISATVRNSSGQDLPRYAVVGLDEPMILPSADEAEFKSRITFDVVLPQTGTHEFRLGVLLQPLAEDAIGTAALVGVVQVRLAVPGSLEDWAEITDSDTTLTSDADGNIRILFAEPSGAERWAYAMLPAAPPAVVDIGTILDDFGDSYQSALAHDLLSLSHFDTYPGSPAKGYLIVGTGTAAPSISTLTATGATVTATFSADHDLATGDVISVSGATPAEFNGQFPVTVSSPTVATYDADDAPASTPAGGTIVVITPSLWRRFEVGDNGEFIKYDDTSAFGIAHSNVTENSTTFTMPKRVATPQVDLAPGANQNDYDVGDYQLIRLTPSTSINITGLANGTSGRRLTLVNNHTSNTITLKHGDSASTAANRFALIGSLDCVVRANTTIELFYDDTSDRWRVTNASASSPFFIENALGSFTAYGYTLVVDNADGFTISATAGKVRIDMTPATTTVAGNVSTTTQSLAGRKSFTGGADISHATDLRLSTETILPLVHYFYLEPFTTSSIAGLRMKSTDQSVSIEIHGTGSQVEFQFVGSAAPSKLISSGIGLIVQSDGDIELAADGDIVLDTTGAGGIYVQGPIGFGVSPISPPTITGSRGGNAALASLLTALANYGLITDSTSA